MYFDNQNTLTPFRLKVYAFFVLCMCVVALCAIFYANGHKDGEKYALTQSVVSVNEDGSVSLVLDGEEWIHGRE